MKIWIHEPVMAADTGALVNKVKRFVDKLFGGVDKALSAVESWGVFDELEESSERGSEEDQQAEEPQKTKDPEDLTMQFIPDDGIKSWDRSPVFELVAHPAGETQDNRLKVQFKLTSPDGNSITDEATIGKLKEGETPEEWVQRLDNMLTEMGTDMLKELTNNKYVAIAQVRQV